tara:strand:- start:1958 stop:4681 length:2724 start_codon:yes stop_codon:yes gene_type:complete
VAKVLLNTLKQTGLIKEQKESNESFMKKMLMDLGVVIDGTFTFGTGITAFLPTVRELLKGGNPSMTEQDIILLYITAMWILLKRNEDSIARAMKVIREKGLTGLLSKVFDFLKSTEDIVIKMANEVGYTASNIIDITAFTFMTFPILDVLLGLIKNNTISLSDPGGYLKSILISIGILTIKNGFNSILRRIKQRYGKLDERVIRKRLNLHEEFNDTYYNKLTTQIVKDILSGVKKTMVNEGPITLYLPEDTTGDMSYDATNVSVEVTLSRNPDIPEDFMVEAFYSPDDDVIELGLEINPNSEPQSYQKLYPFLIEYIRHELVHYEQNERGELPAEDVYSTNLDYYLQPHEIPAQIKGLDLRAKKTHKSYQEVVKNSVERSKQLYGLTDNEASILYNKLLDGIESQLEKESLQEQDTGGKPKVKKVFENGDYEIIVPLSKDSFCYYAQNTRWCDQEWWLQSNVLGSKTTPYIIIDKRNNTKHYIAGKGNVFLLRDSETKYVYFDRNSTFINTKKFLSDKPELIDFFNTKYNARERIKYNMPFTPEELSTFYETNPFSQALYDTMEGKTGVNLAGYVGDDFDILTRQSWGVDETPQIEYDDEVVTLSIPTDMFLDDYVEIDEDDKYWFEIGMGEGYYDGYEEVDDDELNYMSCWFGNGATFERIQELMKLLGEDKFAEYKECTMYDDGDMLNTFERYFPSLWSNYSDDILVAIGYGLGENRRKNLEIELKEDLPIPIRGINGGYSIILTYPQLLSLINQYPEINTFSDIKNTDFLHLNTSLHETWYDSYEWGEETEEEVDDIMNKFLDKAFTLLEENNLVSRVSTYEKIVKDLGFKDGNYWGYRYKLVQPDERRELHIIEYSPEKDLLGLEIIKTLETGNTTRNRYNIPPSELSDYVLSPEMFTTGEES